MNNTAMTLPAISLLIVATLLRIVLTLFLQSLSRSSFAEKRRVYKIQISSEQHRRERVWIIGVILDSVIVALLASAGVYSFTNSSLKGYMCMAAVHVFIVELIYYWYHRLFHRPFFYHHHHIRHHLSTVTEPVTAMTFTLTERFSYTVLFSVPAIVASYFGLLSYSEFIVYILVFDVLNYIGHLNFEFFPRWFVETPLKWFVYTPSYHSQHHSRFVKNFALFMPIYDLVFGTLEPETETVFHHALSGEGIKQLT